MIVPLHSSCLVLKKLHWLNFDSRFTSRLKYPLIGLSTLKMFVFSFFVFHTSSLSTSPVKFSLIKIQASMLSLQVRQTFLADCIALLSDHGMNFTNNSGGNCSQLLSSRKSLLTAPGVVELGSSSKLVDSFNFLEGVDIGGTWLRPDR